MPKVNKAEDKSIKLLEDLRKLMVLKLLKDGATSEEVGKVLGIDSSRVRHMVPSGRKLNQKSGTNGNAGINH